MERAKKYYYSHYLNDTERKICDMIADGLERKQERVSAKGLEVGFDSVNKAIEVIELDFPEYFYFNASSSMIWKKGADIEVELGYHYSASSIAKTEKKVIERTKAILNTIPDSLSLPQKEKVLHDILMKNTSYSKSDRSGRELHNIIGPLLNGIAVCEGYAKAYKYLCEKLGILCLVVTGDAVSKIDGVRGPHAWNIVRVYGKGCCHVDVTWDSCFYHNGSSGYVFFNQTDRDMKADHSWDTKKVPECIVPVIKGIRYCRTADELEEYICTNIMNNILEFSVMVKKDFKDNAEVSALTQKIISRNRELRIKGYTVLYIAARKIIEYKFEKRQ